MSVTAFVDKAASARACADMMHIQIPSGDDVVAVALTKHAALSLYFVLSREIGNLTGPKVGFDPIPFPSKKERKRRAKREASNA